MNKRIFVEKKADFQVKSEEMGERAQSTTSGTVNFEKSRIL